MTGRREPAPSTRHDATSCFVRLSCVPWCPKLRARVKGGEGQTQVAGGHVTAIALVVNQDAPLRRLERLDHDLRKAHTSARLSTALPLACSGDI